MTEYHGGPRPTGPSAGRAPRASAGRARRASSRLPAGLLAVTAVLVLAGCGGHKRPKLEIAPATVTTIGINSYLWRAALDTLKFLPITQVDSNGGVIITDWYRNPAVPDDRIKLTVAILDGTLRADAVQVSAERQVLKDGAWQPADVRAGTVQRLEEIILEKARSLRQRASVQ